MIEAVVAEEDSVNIATSNMQWVYVMVTCCCAMMVLIMVVPVAHIDIEATHLVNEELGIPNLDPPSSTLSRMLSRVTSRMNVLMLGRVTSWMNFSNLAGTR